MNGWRAAVDGRSTSIYYFDEKGVRTLVLVYLESSDSWEYTTVRRAVDDKWHKLPGVRTLEEAQATAVANWRMS